MTLPASLQSLIDSNAFRFCRLWQVTRVDDVSFYFTDHNMPVEFFGTTYIPAHFDASSREEKAGFSSDSVELKGFLAADAITKEELRARMFADADVTVRVVDWRYPFAGAYRTDVMKIESVKYTGEIWEASVLGLSGILKRKVGKVLNRDCNVLRVGDLRCLVDIEAHRVTGEITAIDETNRVFQTDLTDADGLYHMGMLLWTTTGGGLGLNDTFETEVKQYLNANGQITLQIRTPYLAQVGDTFSIIPGCSRSREDCRGVAGTGGKPWVDNILNFRGSPNMPGARLLLKSPDSR